MLHVPNEGMRAVAAAVQQENICMTDKQATLRITTSAAMICAADAVALTAP
jgi:hypothetical protein